MLRRIFLFTFIVVFGFIFFRYITPPSQESLPVIAVTQIIEHNTLDTVREGFFKGIKEAGLEDGKHVRIVYQNAHGQMTTAAQIVQQFANLHPKAVVALSTQSAQLLLPFSKQQNIPLIFSAVTDPVAAKIVQDVKTPIKGVTGVSDYMPPLPQIKMIKAFAPHIKVLGVLHNPSEVNSTLFLQKDFSKAAKEEGLTLVFSPLNNTNESVSATRHLMGKVDALYFPNDNTAMASVPSIVSIAYKHNIPVFANDQASVEQGAIAALSYDRIQMGKDTANLVIQALKEGRNIEIPTIVGGKIQTVVNMASLQKLNLVIPQSLKDIVKISGE